MTRHHPTLLRRSRRGRVVCILSDRAALLSLRRMSAPEADHPSVTPVLGPGEQRAHSSQPVASPFSLPGPPGGRRVELERGGQTHADVMRPDGWRERCSAEQRRAVAPREDRRRFSLRR